MVFVDMLPFIYPQLTVVFICTHSLSHDHLHHYRTPYLSPSPHPYLIISPTTYCQWFSSICCLSLSIWSTHWCWSWPWNEPWDALCAERTTRNHHVFHGQSFTYPGTGRTLSSNNEQLSTIVFLNNTTLLASFTLLLLDIAIE